MPSPALADTPRLRGGISSKPRPYFEIINPEIVTAGRTLGRDLTLLDVGCGSGLHAHALHQALGWRPYGVDNSAVSIDKARSRDVDACVGDVYRPAQYRFEQRPLNGFDVLLFSDILEHLTSPLDVLREHLQLVSPSGAVILSIPNIAIWHARLRLLAGTWRYEDTGTFDRTHLVFFTRRTIHEMIDAAGLIPVYSRISPGVVRPFVPLIKKLYSHAEASDGQPDSSSILDSKPYQAYQKWLYPLESAACRLWPTLLAFQFVVVCRRKDCAQ